MPKAQYQSEVVVVGGGLAGLATAFELLDHGKKVLILERDSEKEFGGLAKKSFGGVMMIGTPHQKKIGIRDSPELAWKDWLSFAEFEDQDHWPKTWARTYVDASYDLIYRWLDEKGVEFLPVVNWPERGLFVPGNSVPRWHITWGTGFELVRKVLQALEQHPNRSNLEVRFLHKVDGLLSEGGKVVGCRGSLPSNDEQEDFEARAEHVVIAAGGICGGDLSELRANWYKGWGKPPMHMLNGSHRFADGLMHKKAQEHGAKLTHLDLQWLYAAGVHHPNPEMPNHGLSLVPPRSALWMDATGRRFGPQPLMGYTDTRYVVEQISKSEHQYSWQIMNWKIAIKELAVSGSDYMTAFRKKSKFLLVKNLLLGNTKLVKRLMNECVDVVAADSIEELADKMNALTGTSTVNKGLLKEEIHTYDYRIRQGSSFHNDHQLRWIANFRRYRGDRLRTCNFQPIDDPKARPLIAIREFILSRKSLGGLLTDDKCRILNEQNEAIEGLYSVGEAAGFGGGGIHGKRSLEGTFLGACVLTGRICGKSIAGKEIN